MVQVEIMFVGHGCPLLNDTGHKNECYSQRKYVNTT